MMNTKSNFKTSEFGQIPSDWEEAYFFDNIERTFDYRGKTPKKIGMSWGEGDIPALSANNVKNGYIDFNAECYLASEELYNKWMSNGDLRKDDILFTMEAPLGNVTLVPDDRKYILSQRVVALRTNSKLNPQYFKYYIDSDKFRNSLKNFSTGTTAKGISQKNLSKLKVILPPVQEQQKIAEILSTVDEQIEQTDQLIKKTTELKKGLMQQLLTKGIGHTEFKQSDLGEIPVRWDVKVIPDLVTPEKNAIKIGPFGSQLKKELLVNKGYKVYGQENVIAKDFEKGNRFLTDEHFKSLKTSELKPGDFVITMMGTIGKCAIFPNDAVPGIMDSHLLRIRLNKELYINELLLHVINSDLVQKQLKNLSVGGVMAGLSSKTVKQILLPVPPIEEQNRIAEILSSVDEELEGYQEERAKYEELKKGLMQQLLTGKVRVKV